MPATEGAANTQKPTFYNLRDFQAAARLLNVHAALANRTKVFGKDSKNGDKSLWITINTKRIAIEYRKPQPAANVRDSSRESYAALDTGTLQGKVAACILEASFKGGNITRAEVAHAMQMEKSTITARIKELLDMSEAGTIALNGQHYRLVEMPERRLSRCPGASNTKSYALRLVMSAPANYQPAAPAAQTNVLHERSAFEDDPRRPRLLYRARYVERIAGTEGAWDAPSA